jgi:alpha-galactosidase
LIRNKIRLFKTIHTIIDLKPEHMKLFYKLLIIIACLIFISCGNSVRIRNGKVLLEINNNLETKVSPEMRSASPFMNDFSQSEYLVCNNTDAKLFAMTGSSVKSISGTAGTGKRTIIKGLLTQGEFAVEKILEVTAYDSYPDIIFLKVKYINKGNSSIEVNKWVNNSYNVLSTGSSPAFWSFQASSTSRRRDWMLPVDSSFSQRNFMGMNNKDYGGGIPLLDLWRKDAGIAIGHVELLHQMVSLPVIQDNKAFAQMSILHDYTKPFQLAPGDTLKIPTTFVAVHKGDCYNPLQTYSKFMQASGIKLPPVENEAFEAVWCGWGYQQNFTIDEILGTLPKIKELGIKWLDIDYGYEKAEGDWNIPPDRFPNGEKDMRMLVDTIHSMGMKAKLWWCPLAVDPGSDLLTRNPDIIQLSEDGSPQSISFWDSYYMSPVYQKTIDHTKGVLKMFLSDWDFDGLKIDGMHLNLVPPDYNVLHNLKYPEQSSESVPQFFRMVYETTRSYKPDAVIQICPCGCAMSYFIMPFTNQTVASDPTSSWQIRLKGKTYRALLGNSAYYADHVELSDEGNDFASQMGVGAVLGTKFTWPGDNPAVAMRKRRSPLLTPEKEVIWKKWFSLYNQKMISRGNYLGDLYDIGFDKPETHVIRKSDTLFFAFYNPEWKGEIELRGLGGGNYKVYDYVNMQDLGMVSGKKPTINVEFKKNLLIEVYPVK